MKNLAQTLGPENVDESSSALISYSTDASRAPGKAKIIVFPDSLEDVRKTMLYASRMDLDIIPRAGGTGLSGAVVPKDSVVLDFSRMNKILQINTKEMTCTVEPGIILDNLNKELAKHNLLFPVLPSSHTVCQIGGMLGTNAGGRRALKYGKTANWVEELEVIDGTRKVWKIKKKDIMNFVGKQGTTGIITKAKLKLTEPLKESTVSFLKLLNMNDVIEKIKELKIHSTLISLEYLNKKTAELLKLEPKDHLIAEFESGQGEIKDKEEIDKIFKLREEAYPAIAKEGYMTIEDPKIEDLENLSKLLNWLNFNDIPAFGHIGEGVLHPNFKEDQAEKIKEMFKKVKEYGGKITGEHGIGLTKKEFAPEKYKEIIKKLKQKYDPENHLNRGKLI